jgi:hypothetical protein
VSTPLILWRLLLTGCRKRTEWFTQRKPQTYTTIDQAIIYRWKRNRASTYRRRWIPMLAILTESARFTSLPFELRFELFTLDLLFHVVDCGMLTFIMAWSCGQLVLRNGMFYRQSGFRQRFCIAAASRSWFLKCPTCGSTFFFSDWIWFRCMLKWFPLVNFNIQRLQ